MQTNLSLVVNILLLIGVIIAISRMIRQRQKNNQEQFRQPHAAYAEKIMTDDIISVRKINIDLPDESASLIKLSSNQSDTKPQLSKVTANKPISKDHDSSALVMIFLLAKENRHLAGYELLQTLLSAGLRFGDGQLFHRHQQPNGQGPVLFSLAAATSDGVFDLQNIGAFSARGLCLFMHPSGNQAIDAERFYTLVDTAKQLSEGLDTYLLDGQRNPLTDESIARYLQQLNISDFCEESAIA